MRPPALWSQRVLFKIETGLALQDCILCDRCTLVAERGCKGSPSSRLEGPEGYDGRTANRRSSRASKVRNAFRQR